MQEAITKIAIYLGMVLGASHVISANSTSGPVHANTYIISAKGSGSDTSEVKSKDFEVTKKCVDVTTSYPIPIAFERASRDCKSRNYTDTNKNRIPMDITSVACECEQCVIHGCPGTCKEILYTIPMLFHNETIDNELPLSRFVLRDTDVSVGCQCVANNGRPWKPCGCKHSRR